MTATPDFADRLRELATRIAAQRASIATEEATKHAFVLPFIQLLGYDVFNPMEVTPELVADVGLKKGEKVDYAIVHEGKPSMIFECKAHTSNLRDAEYSQLFRYFHVTDVRFSVLTNGVQYWFFTDLDAPNKMDPQPFLKVDLLNLRDGDLDELRKFTRAQFNVDTILSTASELKYVRELKRALAEELATPSEDFARLLIARVHQGTITAKVRQQFIPFISKAYQAHLSDVFSERLKGVIGQQGAQDVARPAPPETQAQTAPTESPSTVTTTTDEHEAFLIVRAIVSSETDVTRVVIRDVQTYCGVLFDDNNRKPVCRLYLNGKRWQVGLFDTEERSETRHDLSAVTDLYRHSAALRSTVRRYLPATPGGEAVTP